MPKRLVSLPNYPTSGSQSQPSLPQDRAKQLGQLPSELKDPRCHRARPDPVEKDSAEVEARLAEAPELEVKARLISKIKEL